MRSLCKTSSTGLNNNTLNGKGAALLWVRLLSAVALFALLGQANLWLDATSNILLATGYRLLLILTPLTLLLFGARALRVTLLCALAGLLLLALPAAHGVAAVAVLLFSYGIAVVGYIAKRDAATTPAGAANNKIMLNLGSLLAGLLLLYPHWQPTFFYLALALLLLPCLPAVWHHRPLAEASPAPAVARRGQLKWALAGLMAGIKLFAVFSILPQAILAHQATLPGWYGAMIILNSAVVTLLQRPIMALIQRCGRRALWAALALILAGLVVLALPGAFRVHTLPGALLWLGLLSLAECGLSYLDYCAAQEGALLVKELSVSAGAGFTVFAMRTLPTAASAGVLAATTIIALLIWLWLYQRQHKEKYHALNNLYEK